MISDVTIKNFKTLNDFSLNNMGRVNLLSGKNNVGKSSILEALFLYRDHTSNDSFGKISMFRGTVLPPAGGLWDSFFYGLDTNNTILISTVCDGKTGELKYSRDDQYLPNNVAGVPEDVLATFRSANRESYSLRFEYKEGDYTENGHFSSSAAGTLREITTTLNGNEIKRAPQTQFFNSILARTNNLVDVISRLEMMGKKGEVVKALQQIDASIEDIIMLSVQGVPQLYVRVNGYLVPLYEAGDGLIKWLSISLAIMTLNNGLLLIDEIENGFHYSMYGKLWSTLDRLSNQSRCQIIATTHSYELINAVPGNITFSQDFSYHRIGKVDNRVASFRYDYTMLDSALHADMEVR